MKEFYKTTTSFHCVDDFKFTSRGADYFAHNIAEYWVLEFRHIGLRSDAHSNWGEAFSSAVDSGSKWAIFYRPGNQFYCKSEFLDVLYNDLDDETICWGHILDKKESYLEIHPQCFVINMDLYRKIGCPKFDNHEKKIDLQGYERSEENFHGDYTPCWVKGADSKKTTQLTFGSEIISRSFEKGYKVKPFNEKIRNAKIFLYDGDDFLENFSKFKEISDHAVNGFYSVNTERLIESPYPDKKIETLYIPPSGLLPFKLFKEKGFMNRELGDHVNSRLVLYDISSSALEIYKQLMTNWDGRDYPGFLVGLGDSHSIKEKSRLDQEWNSFLVEFNGEENWLNWFRSFKEHCKVQYKNVNILSRAIYNRLFLTPPNQGLNIMWLSNIFHYMPTHLYFSNHQLMTHLNSFMQFMIDNFPGWVVRYNTTEKGSEDIGEFYDLVTNYKALTPAKFPWRPQ